MQYIYIDICNWGISYASYFPEKPMLTVLDSGPYVCAAFFKFTYDSLQMAGPYILKDLLNYLSHCSGRLDRRVLSVFVGPQKGKHG